MWRSWNGPDAINRVIQGGRGALADAGNIVLEQAMAEVPLDEGTLLRSGAVILDPDVESTEGVVTFGGGPGTGVPEVPYARRWHEFQANFQRGRKRYYLRDPFFQLFPQAIVDRSAVRMREQGL